MNGLSIDEREFTDLTAKQQMTILYKNTEELKEMVRGYKLQQKLQWYAIGFIAVLGGVVQYFKLL